MGVTMILVLSSQFGSRCLTSSDCHSTMPGKAGEDAASSAQKPAASETAQGRKYSPLSHLTGQSARFGLWEVAIFNPIGRARKYLWGKEQRTSYSFQCMLVSTQDPKQYVLGDSHGQGMNATKLQAMTEKFQPGLVFHMSKVVFAENTKQQYNSAPKTEVVSMLNTTWSPLLVSAGKPKIAEPTIPVAACMGIDRDQSFDALALIQDISDASNGGKTAAGQERVRCKITLNDGSRNKDTGKVCHMPVTIFADGKQGGDEPLVFKQLRNAHERKTAMALFGIQGKKSDNNDGSWSFTSNFAFFCACASETKKGKELEAKSAEVLEADAEAVPLSVRQSRTFEQNENFADREATETTCALLSTIMAHTQVKAIDSEITFWQINWCQVHRPDKAARICTNDNSRLWMPVKVEDETGCLNLYMRENAALSLSGVDGKEEFEAAWADDSLEFPNKASIKIIRKPDVPQTPTGDNSAEKPAASQCYIVEAGEQSLQDTPSKKSLALLNLLERTEANTDACAPAGISMIKKDPHYGLSIFYVVEEQVVKKRCTRAIALVIANNASKSDNMNEGYQMITENVSDPLDESFSCTLMSFCTVKTSPDYQLKPARGMKTQTAFVVITDVLEEGSADKPPVLLVESFEKIPDEDAAAAPDHIRRLIQFASLTAKMQGTSATRQWTDDISPANAYKCRRLGKAPTDDELEKYSRVA